MLDIKIYFFLLELQGPISVSEISLPAGQPGCQTENYQFQKKSGNPTWEAKLKGKHASSLSSP